MTYKESLHRIWLITKREVHRLVAQPIYFFCMLIAPAICVIFFVSLMHEGLPTDLPIAVVDMDNSATSRNLIRQLDAFEQTEVYMKTMVVYRGSSGNAERECIWNFLHSIRFRRGRHIWKAAPVVFLYEWYLFDRRFLAVSGYENNVGIGGGRCGFTDRTS